MALFCCESVFFSVLTSASRCRRRAISASRVCVYSVLRLRWRLRGCQTQSKTTTSEARRTFVLDRPVVFFFALLTAYRFHPCYPKTVSSNSQSVDVSSDLSLIISMLACRQCTILERPTLFARGILFNERSVLRLLILTALLPKRAEPFTAVAALASRGALCCRTCTRSHGVEKHSTNRKIWPLVGLVIQIPEYVRSDRFRTKDARGFRLSAAFELLKAAS